MDKCKICGNDIPEELDYCPICKSVKNNEGTKNTNSNKLIPVFTTWDTFEVSFVQSILEANGITPIINNIHYATIALVGSAAAPITILVTEDNLEKAKDIINQYYEDIKKERDNNMEEQE